MIAIGIAAALGGFWLGYFVAGLVATSAAADRQLEEMRRKHEESVIDWFNRKREEMH